MGIAQNIQALLDKREMNANQLSEATKVPQPTIHRILNGDHKSPRDPTIQPIEDYFGVSVSDLRYGEITPTGGLSLSSRATGVSVTGAQTPRRNFAVDASDNLHPGPELKGRVPLISWVQAGEWNSVVDNFHPGHADEWIETTVPVRQHTYALRVNGDSMTNPSGSPSFPHGIIIIVEPEVEAIPGAFVVVRQNNDEECTFKQLVKDAGVFFLKPLNPAYPLMRLAEDAVICGVVREATMRFF
jgi:SOS-response transcriptional repressor LexA